MKKNKGIIVILIVTLFLSVVPKQYVAAETNNLDSEGTAMFYSVNPLYEEVIDQSYLEQFPAVMAATVSRSSEYLSESAASDYIRDQMELRNTNIQLNVVSGIYPTDDELRLFVENVFRGALVHTGVPTEGDYLHWQYAGYRCSISFYNQGDVGYYSLTYMVPYYTSAEQEAVVDSAVEELLTELDLAGKTDYEKIRSIYDYICANVEYDYLALENPGQDLLAYTAYGALIENSCVCQGYANLLYRLVLEVGVDARLIAGTSDGQRHAWNIVELGKWYYNLDSTWDA